MRLSFFKSPAVLIAAPVIAAVCILQLTRAVYFQKLEWITYDARVRLAQRFSSDSSGVVTNLGFVAVSDGSIAAVDSGILGYQYGLYWPRQIFGRGLQELTRQHAKAVAFDVLFSEDRPDQPPYVSGDVTNSSDDFFAGQIEQAGNVVLAAQADVLPSSTFFSKAVRVGSINAEPDADSILRRERPYVWMRRWHDEIKALGAQYNFNYDRTEVATNKIIFHYRRGDGDFTYTLPVGSDGYAEIRPGDSIKPFRMYRAWALGICLAAQQLGLDLDHPDIQTNRHRIVLHGLHQLTRVIPLNPDGTFYIDWSLALNDNRLAQWDFSELLQAPLIRATNGIVPDYWSNKLAVIGSTATGNDLADMGATPLENQTHLAIKHLNVAASLLGGRFITQTSLPIDLALIIFIGILFSWITLSTAKPLASTVIVVALGVLYIALAAGLFVQWRIWVPIVLPLGCSGFVTHLLTMTNRVRLEQNERKRVKDTFQKLVAPDIVNELLESQSLSLSSRRELTIYFADVRGFTELSDVTQQRAEAYVAEHKLTPEQVEAYYDEQARDVLNTVSVYLGTITNAIKAHQGTLDKYIGDCVMAFWGAPIANPNHALDAVRAAIDSQRALHALNRQREAQNARREEENAARIRVGLPPHPPLAILSMGSGINTGVAIAGLMGSINHVVNYTVFGREVNLASRLEGVSGHGRIIIGEGTYRAILPRDSALAATCIELSPQKVKGFREPVRIYQVPWETDGATGATEFIEKTTQFIQKTTATM